MGICSNRMGKGKMNITGKLMINERNWEEDYNDENGQYLGKCFQCNNTFVGHQIE